MTVGPRRSTDPTSSNPLAVLESLDMTTFAGRVGELFRILIDEANTLTTRLIEVTPGPDAAGRPAHAGGRAPFSLVFRSPPGAPLPQHIYRLQHDELGVLDLFLVPIGPDDEGMRYEAVFS
jgi:hypothetical protein